MFCLLQDQIQLIPFFPPLISDQVFFVGYEIINAIASEATLDCCYIILLRVGKSFNIRYRIIAALCGELQGDTFHK